jgi:stage V sporulation protein R
VRHNQVVRPFPRGFNPYYLGLKLWDDIKRRHDEPTPEEIEKYGTPTKTGMQAIFEAREVDRDVSFLRRFLTEELMREMDMFQYEPRGDEMVIAKVSDQEGWREVKGTLLKNLGMGTVPVIKIEDADHNHNRTLYMKHDHDGRDLQWEYAERTLAHMHRLWGYAVVLETIANG